MAIAFYVSGAVSLIAAMMVITRSNAVHALLYLIVCLLALATVFYSLGAPFVAALEVIVYAGAIMVLFVFVVMMLNLGAESADRERQRLAARHWIGPAALAGVLVAELAYVALTHDAVPPAAAEIGPKQVGVALFGRYLLGVEFASFLLLAGLVAAYHVGRRRSEQNRDRT